MKVFILSVFFSLALAFGGCSDNKGTIDDTPDNSMSIPDMGEDDDDGDACLDDSDCPAGSKCVNNSCRSISDDDDNDDDSAPPKCSSDSDCGPGMKCQSGKCIDIPDAGDDDDADDDDNDAEEKGELELFPNTLDFTEIVVGERAEKTLIIFNSGDFPVKISEAKLSEGTSAEFAIDPPFEPATIAPSQKLEVTVAYLPIDMEPDTGALLITNDSKKPLLQVPVRSFSKGLVEIAFYDTEDPPKKVWPLSASQKFEVDFGKLEAGDRKDFTYIVKNEGTGPASLEIFGAAINAEIGVGQDMFKLQMLEAPSGKAINPPLKIGPGDTRAVRLTYQPSERGAHSAVAEISTNDLDVNNDNETGDDTVIINLSGSMGTSASASIEVSPKKIDFGNVLVGEKVCDSLTITNASASEDLKITADFKKDSDPEFTKGTVPTTIKPEKSAAIEICFKPLDKGEFSAIMEIGSNDPEQKTIEVEFAGKSYRPELELFPEPPVDFGKIVVSAKVDKMITLKNVGGGSLTIQNITLDSQSTDISIKLGSQTFPFILDAPDKTMYLGLTFLPQSAGIKSGTVTISHNGNDAGFTLFSVSGEGIPPADAIISIAPTSLSFDALQLGEYVDKNIEISNSGTADLQITGANVENFPTAFYVDHYPTLIPPGAAENLSVRFFPKSSGAHTNTLVIQSNANNFPSLQIPLSGSATGECFPNAQDSRTCGTLCGRQTRTCGANAIWSDWSECVEGGDCLPGETDSRACGFCGTETRACNSSCQWGNYGSCLNQGVCTAGTEEKVACEGCQSKSRTCSDQCQWSAWSECVGSSMCSPGESGTETCNVCGTQSKTCNNQCEWEYTACSKTLAQAQDIMEPNDTRTTAYYVGKASDCEDDNISPTKGNIVPLGEVDWYRAYFKDDSLCSINNVSFELAEIPYGQDYDMIAYMDTSDCRSNPGCGNGSMTCTNADPDCVELPAGVTGCKSVNSGTANEKIRFNCFEGMSSDSGDIYVRIKPKTSSGGSCQNYAIYWDLR